MYSTEDHLLVEDSLDGRRTELGRKIVDVKVELNDLRQQKSDVLKEEIRLKKARHQINKSMNDAGSRLSDLEDELSRIDDLKSRFASNGFGTRSNDSNDQAEPTGQKVVDKRVEVPRGAALAMQLHTIATAGRELTTEEVIELTYAANRKHFPDMQQGRSQMGILRDLLLADRGSQPHTWVPTDNGIWLDRLRPIRFARKLQNISLVIGWWRFTMHLDDFANGARWVFDTSNGNSAGGNGRVKVTRDTARNHPYYAERRIDIPPDHVMFRLLPRKEQKRILSLVTTEIPKLTGGEDAAVL